MLNPSASFYEPPILHLEAESQGATEREWKRTIHKAQDAALYAARVGIETDDLAFDHERDEVTFTWGVTVDSLEPSDLANALESAAAAIRLEVARG